MDYIAEMTAFTDWLETNPLEPSAQTLWFHLMVIANKSGYPEWFAVANPLLQAKAGISENTLTKHRNTLIQKGRIEYKPQGKQKAGKYKLITLTSNIEVNREVKCAVNHEVKPAVKGSALFKDLNSSTSSSAAGGLKPNESFYSAHERVFGFSCNPFQAQRLADYIDQDGMEEGVVVRAIERAALASTGYKFNLIMKILDDYFRSGAMTLEKAVALDEQYSAGKSTGTVVQVPTRPKTKQQRELDELDRFIEEEKRRGAH